MIVFDLWASHGQYIRTYLTEDACDRAAQIASIFSRGAGFECLMSIAI